jgi:hypothetical protein
MKALHSARLAVLLSLFASLSLRADLAITGVGVVSIGGSSTLHIDGGSVTIENGARLKIQAGGTLVGSTVVVGPAGKLINCGAIHAAVSNAGEVVADCGVISVFLGNVTNSGVFRVSHGSTLVATAGFHNSPGGLLDLITAAPTGPPPSLTGTGTVIEADDVRIEKIQMESQGARIVIQGIPPHTYRLMGSSTLSPPDWAPVGPLKAATGGPLQWDHTGVATTFDRYFYRVIVGDP